MAVTSDRDGTTRTLTADGNRSFTGTSLTRVRDEAEGKNLLHGGVPTQTHSDGNIAWGRWTDGKHNIGSNDDDDDDDEGKGTTRALHYFTFAGTPSLPVVKTFNSFGSTATTITSSGGRLLATGVENAAAGTLRVTFPGTSGGFASFALTVPVSSQTFSLTGTALQTGTYGFAGAASIASTGAGCASGCAGALGNGAAVRGLVGGAGSSRAGLLYGFTSGLGVVTGAMVFKP